MHAYIHTGVTHLPEVHMLDLTQIFSTLQHLYDIKKGSSDYVIHTYVYIHLYTVDHSMYVCM